MFHSETLLCSKIIPVYSSGLDHILVNKLNLYLPVFQTQLHSSMAGLSYNNKRSVLTFI